MATDGNTELSNRVDNFHSEVARWEGTREVYFDRLADDATALAEELLKQGDQRVDSVAGPRGPSTPLGLDASAIPLAATEARSAAAKPAFTSRENFPWRDMSDDFGKTAEGLPPRRKLKGQSEAWLSVYETFLPLPSSYHALVQRQEAMGKFVELEMDFRRSMALRTLEDLRTNIIGAEVIKMAKKKVVGKTLTTRARAMIQTADTEVEKVANLYRRHRQALLALGMPDNDPHIRPLLDADVQTFEMSTAQEKPGKSTRPTSWLWGNLSFVDTKQDAETSQPAKTESEQDCRYRDFYEDGTLTPLRSCLY